jgi:type VI secretion system protein VasI
MKILWRIGLGLILGAVIAGSAWPQAADEIDVPAVKKCLKETEAAALQECVRRLATLVMLSDRIEKAQKQLLQACLAGDDATLRHCAAKFAGSSDPQRQAREKALDAALRTWEVVTGESRLDSSSTVVLRIESDDELQSNVGSSYRAWLYLRCRENATSAFVTAEQWFLTGDQVSIAYRVDKEKPQAQTWARSTNYNAAGIWDGARAIPFIKSLLGHETLVVRVTSRDGVKESAFNIAGLEVHVGPLKQACKW